MQDVGSKAKEFGYLSGAYNMDLIVGDAVIQNPFSWTLAEVHLTFPDSPTTAEDTTYRYKARPEIKVLPSFTHTLHAVPTKALLAYSC